MKLYHIYCSISPNGVKETVKEFEVKETKKTYKWEGKNGGKSLKKDRVGVVASMTNNRISLVTHFTYSTSENLEKNKKMVFIACLALFNEFESNYLVTKRNLDLYLLGLQ